MFNNDRLVHWFVGALLAWATMFLLCFPILHFWLKLSTTRVAMFFVICGAVQLVATPLLFSARSTRQNPSGRIAQRATVVIASCSAIALLFFYYLRRSWFGDAETRRFTAIAVGVTILFGLGNLIRYRLAPPSHK
ncbi:MAG TPA: hypothetical protein VIW23_18165 [Candidatus Acidoferrum sp.]